MSSTVSDFTQKYWSMGAKVRRNSSGWMTRNAPCCVHRGENADTRQRGGLIVSSDGTITYHCFNCKFKAKYIPGDTLSVNFKKLLNWLGASETEIDKLGFDVWLNSNKIKNPNASETPKVWKPKFAAKFLPKGAKTLEWWADNDPTNEMFVAGASYLANRDPNLIGKHPYYITNEITNKAYGSIIVPLRFKGQNVGWVGRYFTPDAKVRYNGEQPDNFLFNADVMYDERREIILIVEGIFDAINLNCVGALGSSINDDQAQWINSFGKRVIVAPDLDKAGNEFIDNALKYKWEVSIPPKHGSNKVWDARHKDISAAVQEYGAIYTLATILDNATSNKLEIDFRRSFF